MSRVYIESSIISYLRQRPSGQVVAAARQLLTRTWWDEDRGDYDLVTSQYVIDEVALGDPSLATDRLSALTGIPLLELPPAVPQLAHEILKRAVLPLNAQVDSLHIAAATFHEVDYLLTWNCKHIANARLLPKLRDLLTDLGYRVPTICTPEEMVGEL